MKAKQKRMTFLRGYVGGIVTVLALTSVVAWAAPQTLQAVFGIGVTLDGEALTFEEDSQPFVVDGRTFLPLRAMADVLGLDVDFDRENNQAVLTTPALPAPPISISGGEPTAPTAPTETPDGPPLPASGVASAYSPYLLYVTNLDYLLAMENGFVYIGRPTCPHCVDFVPVLVELLERTGTYVYYFNTDDWRPDPRFGEITGHFEVSTVPSMFIIEDGVPRLLDRSEDAETFWKSYFER